MRLPVMTKKSQINRFGLQTYREKRFIEGCPREVAPYHTVCPKGQCSAVEAVE